MRPTRPSSEEDAADDFQPCTITVEYTLMRVQTRSEFAMLRPDLFGALEVNVFLRAQRSLTKVSSVGKRQTPILASLRSDNVNTPVVSILLWCHEAALCLSNVEQHSTHGIQLVLVLCATS
jgi:hypothetical protein